MAMGVMRKPGGLRSPAIFDSERFDQIAFELVTLRPTECDSLGVSGVEEC